MSSTSAKVGTISKATLTINNIGPLIALIVKVTIIIPLLIGYQYERKRRELGDRKTLKERERKVISLSLCAENDPK